MDIVRGYVPFVRRCILNDGIALVGTYEIPCCPFFFVFHLAGPIKKYLKLMEQSLRGRNEMGLREWKTVPGQGPITVNNFPLLCFIRVLFMNI